MSRLFHVAHTNQVFIITFGMQNSDSAGQEYQGGKSRWGKKRMIWTNWHSSENLTNLDGFQKKTDVKKVSTMPQFSLFIAYSGTDAGNITRIRFKK